LDQLLERASLPRGNGFCFAKERLRNFEGRFHKRLSPIFMGRVKTVITYRRPIVLPAPVSGHVTLHLPAELRARADEKSIACVEQIEQEKTKQIKQEATARQRRFPKIARSESSFPSLSFLESSLH